MTKENKELLLKDLSARLPYKVKASYYGAEEECEIWDEIEGITNDGYVDIGQYSLPIEAVKPYLFPLSNISDEIIDEIYNNAGVYDICIDSPVHIEIGTKFEDLAKIFDILHKHHIDYQNLIKKGLAIDAAGSTIY